MEKRSEVTRFLFAVKRVPVHRRQLSLMLFKRRYRQAAGGRGFIEFSETLQDELFKYGNARDLCNPSPLLCRTECAIPKSCPIGRKSGSGKPRTSQGSKHPVSCLQ